LSGIKGLQRVRKTRKIRKELDVEKLTRQMKIIHFEFLEEGRTMNQHCYLKILARLREAVSWRRPDLWHDAWILYHDNALAHDVLTVWDFLSKKSIVKLDHPPYLPDLAPCDFWLFPKQKTVLKSHRFSDIADMHDHPAEHSRRGVPEMF
jgi:hypothetical protein